MDYYAYESFNKTIEQWSKKKLEGATPPVMPSRPGIYLWSQPRTASNMFVKMLSGQSGLANVQYEMMMGAHMPTRHSMDGAKNSEEEAARIRHLYESMLGISIEKMEAAVKDGKKVLFKEHAFVCIDRHLISKQSYGGKDPNPDEAEAIHKAQTLRMPGQTEPGLRTSIVTLPDEFLINWLPVFLIRHPVLMMTSQYRVFSKVTKNFTPRDITIQLYCTYQWSRAMYDWYVEQGVPGTDQLDEKSRSAWPVVLDADDVIQNKNVVDKFCEIAGLNKDEILYSWTSAEPPSGAPKGMTQLMLGTLMGSTGPVPVNKPGKGVDVDAEVKKWTELYGEDTAKEMLAVAMEAMPNYEYLRAKRLTVVD